MLVFFLLIFILSLVFVGCIKSALFDCKGMVWLHVPKTGSSFCLTLQHVCCTEEFELLTHGFQPINIEQGKSGVSSALNIDTAYGCAYARNGSQRTCHISGSHNPLSISTKTIEKDVIGLFRNPQNRIISSFLDGRHHEGMPAEDYLVMQRDIDNVTTQRRDPKGFLYDKARVYINQPDMFGCQVKMLNGYECSASTFSHQPFNSTALSFAIDRLHQFFFIGITDYFDLSVQLFHKMARHNTVPFPIEFVATRTSRPADTELLLQNISYYDPYDSVLYKEALLIFRRNLDKYHVPHSLDKITG